MIVLTGLFYGVFARMREQVCTTICPYGRLQGVLMDKHSMVVAYDYKRGENRGKFRKKQDRTTAGLGDCIDCKQCVFVCPIGIDIRNGTQLECTNCTACMDACDSIMTKINQPKGLIRYASEEGIKEGKPFRFTKRMVAYSVVLCLLMVLSASQLLMRTEVETTVMRTPGILYQQRDDGTISNLYNVKVVNKTNRAMVVSLMPVDENVNIEMVGDSLKLEPNATGSGSFFLIKDQEHVQEVSSKLAIDVYTDGQKIDKVKTRFLGPVK